MKTIKKNYTIKKIQNKIYENVTTKKQVRFMYVGRREGLIKILRKTYINIAFKTMNTMKYQ